jgi:hypothetical protein
MRLHTETQLHRLPGSALKVPVVVGGWWWVPTHYKVNLQLMLSLSWAVTTTHVVVELGCDNSLQCVRMRRVCTDCSNNHCVCS